MHELPPAVIASLGPRIENVSVVAEEPIGLGTGAATDGVTRLTVAFSSPHGHQRIAILRKRLAPINTGRHAAGAHNPRHWAYWRHEIEAYTSTLLPRGPGLRAPHCYAVEDDDLYLEEVEGERPSIERAAEVLAGWQCPWGEALDHPWLSINQLASRVAVSDLKWTNVDWLVRAGCTG